MKTVRNARGREVTQLFFSANSVFLREIN